MSLVLSRCRCVVIKNEVRFELNIIGVVLIIKYDAIFICIGLIDVADVNLLLFLCIDELYIYIIVVRESHPFCLKMLPFVWVTCR